MTPSIQLKTARSSPGIQLNLVDYSDSDLSGGEGRATSPPPQSSKKRREFAKHIPSHTTEQTNGEVLSPKRQRTTRYKGYNPLNYDTRLHPLDKYTRPAHFAKVSAEHGGITKHSEQSDTSDEDVDTGSQEVDQATDEDEDVYKDNFPIEASTRTAPDPSTARLPSPNRRRSSRNLARREMPNYNMKVHPDYDRVLRPATIEAASRKLTKYEYPSRRVSAETDSTSTLVGDNNKAQNVTTDLEKILHRRTAFDHLALSGIWAIAIPPIPKARPVTQSTGEDPSEVVVANKSPPKSLSHIKKTPSKNPSLKSVNADGLGEVLDFNKLSSLDSRLYRLQMGAPTHGTTLPRSWDHVKRDLFDNGEITLDAFHSQDGTIWLKGYYEQIRCRIEAFWASKPEPKDARNWTLRRLENFRIFDLEPGSNYWRHKRDSLVRPISTGWRGLHQAHETSDREETYLTQRNANSKGASAPELSSPLQVSYGKEPILGFGGLDEDEEQDYIDLGDSVEDDRPDRTAFRDIQNDPLQSMPLFSAQDFADLLSPVEEYFIEDQVTGDPVPNSPIDIALSDPSSSVATGLRAITHQRISPSLTDPEADAVSRGPSISPPRLLEAFYLTKATSVSASDDPDSSQHVDKPRVSNNPFNGRKRKFTDERGVLVHEDSPGRKVQVHSSYSPKTDLPKENLEDEVADSPNGVFTRTPTARRHYEAISTPPIPGVALAGNAKTTPAHLPLLGGSTGQRSPHT